MLRARPDTEPAPGVIEQGDSHGNHLIPLSHLALDLPEPPAGGWVAYLSGRGIEVVPDDIGRPAIARCDAKQLILEKQQGEAHAREVAARQEREAVERDRAFRAALPAGLHWTDIPVGATAADVWAQHEKDSRPRRRSVLEDALANEGTVLHSLAPEPDQS